MTLLSQLFCVKISSLLLDVLSGFCLRKEVAMIERQMLLIQKHPLAIENETVCNDVESRCIIAMLFRIAKNRDVIAVPLVTLP